jgi:hypothetical protein
MKNTATWIQRLVVGVALMALVASAIAQNGNQATAKVTRIKGSARYAAGSNVWQPLKVGDTLKAGTTIQTAAHSMVDLVLGEGEVYGPQAAIGEYLYYQPLEEQNVVLIYADSVLALDKLTVAKTGADEVSETQLDLKAGSIFGRVKRLSAASKYEIKIPNGVAGIRGTIYSISADGILSVLVGSVVIAYVGPDGNVITQVVNGGYQFDARTGQITPLSDLRKQELTRTAKQAAIGLNPPPRAYPVDKTYLYISPTTGS